MVPEHEHAFYAWLIVIGAVCVVTLIGAAIDRYYLKRRLRADFEREKATEPAPAEQRQ